MPKRSGFPDVITAARNGDRAALEALYRDLGPAVFGYLRGQGCPDPEDVTSEVFVGVVRRLGRFDGNERDFRAWVFSIAHRRMMDSRRRLARRKDQSVDPAELTTRTGLHPQGDVESEAMARLGEGWAVALLSRLTEDQRTVLLLRILGDLSVGETARVLGRSAGSVKALQARALAALARYIERQGVS